jgi:hypothetical protein
MLDDLTSISACLFGHAEQENARVHSGNFGSELSLNSTAKCIYGNLI